MWFDQSFISLSLLILLMGFGLVGGESKWELRGRLKHAPLKNITVDHRGHGDFRTIQSAIDSVPSNNKHWIRIYVMRGIYREKVIIPRDKPFIVLEGVGRRRTSILWDDHDTVAQSPTFTLLADHFVARFISFKNTYIQRRMPAVAALVEGDKASFYKCGFFGVQDTLWDSSGRHYFKKCYIEGAVDFIFGMGQSIYEECAISVTSGTQDLGANPGYITAQGRENPTDTNGFVFKNCKVSGLGQAYLGRAWRNYSMVLFYNTFLSNVIVPQGWNSWNFAGLENHITYAEHGCRGSGSNTSGRVNWEKKLSESELARLTSMSFIDEDGWFRRQPFHRSMV